ncbi:MAG: nickel pincer cofactor biosynthesis protein LarC [Nitrososphaerales archaeon]
MKDKILVIDASSAGISGDMLVASLVDLGAPQRYVLEAMVEAVKVLEQGEAEIDVEEAKRGGFRCKLIKAKYKQRETSYTPTEILEAVKTAAKITTHTKKAAEYAYRAVKMLIDTEAHLHNKTIDNLHLHETAGADTLAEAIGAAVALEQLDLLDAQIYATPVAVGGGLIKFSHGITPSPSPAALSILTISEIPFHGGPVEMELTTPTGASLLAALNPKPTRFYPQIKPLKIGFGGGLKEIDALPNILRIILGSKTVEDTQDTIVQLETNVDDVTGEVISRTSEILMKQGALDVATTPAYLKKGRPGWVIKVLCRQEEAFKLSNILMLETGTLGVRTLTIPRYLARRRMETKILNIKGKKYKVRVKVSETPEGKLIRVKPEFKDLEKISEETEVPLTQLQKMVQGEIEN